MLGAGIILALGCIVFVILPATGIDTITITTFKLSHESSIRDSFKDPDSVNFKDIQQGSTWNVEKAYYGKLNAKNGLGAYTGYKRFIYSTEKGLLVEGSSDEFYAVWEALDEK